MNRMKVQSHCGEGAHPHGTMAADGLKTEVSTDILLTQTGEEGKSGVLFVVSVLPIPLTFPGRY